MTKFVIFLLIVFVSSVLARGEKKKPQNCDDYGQQSPKKEYKNMLTLVAQHCKKIFQEKDFVVFNFETIKGKKKQCCILETNNGHTKTRCRLEVSSSGYACSCSRSS